MKRLVFAACLLAVVLCAAGSAPLAQPVQITVEWGYTPPTEPAVVGFRLYQLIGETPTPVHDWLGGNLRQGGCTVDISAEEEVFTLTALFSDGTESPHSHPCSYFLALLPQPLRFVLLGRPGAGFVPLRGPGWVRLH